MKINISIFKGILKSLKSNGVDISKYSSFLDIDDLFLPKKEHEQLIDATQLFNLFSEIRKEYNTSEIFYPLFNNMHVLDMGLLGHYLLTCKNIFTSYEKLLKYQLIFSNFIEFKYKQVGNNIHWSLQMPYQIYNDKYNMESLSDFELFFRMKIVESMAAMPVYPKKIELFYNKNKSEARLEFFKTQFKCEVVYTKRNNVLIFSIQDLNKEIHFENYTLYKNLEPLLVKKISTLYKGKTYHNTIKSILLNNIESFPIPIKMIATKMHMSARKLQQILKDENKSYTMILQEVKIILGIEYLNNGKKIKEISYTLGYKEPNSFTRQFTQMTNVSPLNYLKLNKEEQQQILNNLSS